MVFAVICSTFLCFFLLCNLFHSYVAFFYDVMPETGRKYGFLTSKQIYIVSSNRSDTVNPFYYSFVKGSQPKAIKKPRC